MPRKAGHKGEEADQGLARPGHDLDGCGAR